MPATVTLASIWHLAADSWTAIATWVGVGIAGSAGGVGFSQLREARHLRREQAQPYVVVFTESSGDDRRHQDLVIKNMGKTVARNVRVLFSERLESAVLRGTPSWSPIQTPDVIPVLVPEQEWRTFWDFTVARAEANDLPDHYTATVTFEDADGRALGPYEFVINWRLMIDRGDIEIKNLHDIGVAIEAISKTLAKKS